MIKKYCNNISNKNITHDTFSLYSELLLKLDFLFLKKMNPLNFETDKKITFKMYILEDIFPDLYEEKHNDLKKYFSLIGNEYYVYIYFFLDFAKKK